MPQGVRTWPPPLAPGALVAGIAPSGPPFADLVAGGVALLRSWGLRVRLGQAAYAGDPSGYLAASDTARLADLHDAFADPAVAGIVCLRGGYGATRLLERLDVDLARANPKPLVGFSDVTALHVALGQRAGLVTFHGPSLQWSQDRLTEASAASLRASLFGHPQGSLAGEPLVGGRASGPLVGGNLSLLASLCGTGDQLRAGGCVLLLEDVAERPYRVDRALVQLRQAGVTDGVAAVACDPFHRCVETRADRRSASVRQVVAEWAQTLGVPAVWGLPLGHGPDQRTVALGAVATVDGDAGTLALADPPGPAEPSQG